MATVIILEIIYCSLCVCRSQRLAERIISLDKPNSLSDALCVLREFSIDTPSVVNDIYFRHFFLLIRGDKVRMVVLLL